MGTSIQTCTGRDFEPIRPAALAELRTILYWSIFPYGLSGPIQDKLAMIILLDTSKLTITLRFRTGDGGRANCEGGGTEEREQRHIIVNC